MQKTLKRLRGVTLGGWNLSHVPGSTLDEAQLRAMWRFRTSIFAIKPSWDPEDDYRAFADYCQRCQIVTRLTNAAGELEGMLVTYWRTERRAGQRVTVVLPEFMFLSPEARRRAVLPRMFAGIVARTAPTFVANPVYLAGFGYPSGFITADRFVGTMTLGGEATDDPHLKWVFELLVELAGPHWRHDAGVKDMPTLPHTFSERWVAHQAKHDAYQRYVARCPQWTEGYTLPVAGRITPAGALSRLARHFVRRAARSD